MLLCNAKLSGKSILIPDDHGWAYLVRVINKTNFPGRLEFHKASIGTFDIPAGGDLGDELHEKEETVGGFVAPVGAIRKTRIWDGGKAIAGPHDTKLNKLPTVFGAGIKEISQFDASKMLILRPMYEKAIAWFAQQSLTNRQRPTLNMTLSFVGYVRDKGELQVLFSEKETVGPDWVWKVAFSSSPTGMAKIFKNVDGKAQEVASASNVEFPEARLMPGTFTRFWVSLRGNQIVLGRGSDGKNPFLVWEETGPFRAVKRVGFSSADNPISIARISAMSGVHPEAVGSAMAVLRSGELSKNGVMLREPGSGALAFKVPDFAVLEFSSSAQPEKKVKLEVSANSAKIFDASKSGAGAAKTFFLRDSVDDFWLCFDRDRLIFGQGLPNKTGWLSGSVKNELFKDVDRIKFSVAPKAGAALFSKFRLGAKTWSGSRDGKPMFSGTVKIYQPYAFQFDQAGPVITGLDLIYKKKFLLGKAPQQGAIYPFAVTIDRDGTPSMEWYNKPVNVGKFLLNVTAMASRVSEAMAYKKAEAMTDVEADETKVDLKATAKNIAYALGGAGYGSAAALMEAEADVGFRGEEAYGYTEKAGMSMAKKTKMEQATKYAEQFGLLLAKAKSLNLKSKKDLDYAFQLYSDALGLVKDSQVLSAGQRGELVSGLTTLVAAAGVIYENPKMIASKVARILLMALTNPFLIDRNNLKHKSYANSLNGALQRLFAKLFFDLGRKKLIVPKAGGKFLWTGKNFKNEGSIFFQAKGVGGLFVHMLGFPANAPDSKIGELSWLTPGSPVYEVGLGIERNSMSCIKVSHRGNPVKKMMARKNKQAAMSSFKFKPYWVSFSDGVVSVGQGAWGKGKILEWKDPYPAAGKFMLGLSGMTGAIEVRDVRVGPPVTKLTKAIIAGKTADEIERDKKIAETKAKSGLSELDQGKALKLEQAKSALDVSLLEDYDPFKYDQLAMTNMQLQYNPLEFGELAIEQYQRAKKEHELVQEFASKKAEEKDDDAELERKKALQESRKASQKAAQARESRGAMQKLEAEGMMGVQGELMQWKGVAGDIKSAGKAAKVGFKQAAKGVKNLGRKMAAVKAKLDTMLKRDAEKQIQASVDTGRSRAERAGAKAQKSEKMAKMQRGPDPEKKQRDMSDAAADQTQRAEGRRRDDDDSGDPEGPRKADDDVADDQSRQKDGEEDDWKQELKGIYEEWKTTGEIGREIGQMQNIATSGKMVKSLKMAPAKALYEFSGGKIKLGKLKDADGDAPRPKRKFASDEPDDEPLFDRKIQPGRAYKAAMAVKQTQQDAAKAQGRMFSAQDDLVVAKNKLEALPDGPDKEIAQNQVDALSEQVDQAKQDFVKANEIAKNTYYHGNAQKVYGDRFKLSQAEEKLSKLEAKLAEANLAGKKKLQTEIDKQLKKVDEEREKYLDNVEGNFDQFDSVAGAIGRARRGSDEAADAIKKIQDELNDPNIDRERKAELEAELEDNQNYLAERERFVKKLRRLGNDDGEMLLKVEKLDDLKLREDEAREQLRDLTGDETDEGRQKAEELEAEIDSVAQERQQLLEGAKAMIDTTSVAKLKTMVGSDADVEKWLRKKVDKINKQDESFLEKAKGGLMSELGSLGSGLGLSLLSGGSDESTEEETDLASTAEQQLEELGYIEADDLN